MGIDLTFQIEHGHFLLRQLGPENIRVFQCQIEGQGHQGDSDAADKPGVLIPLQRGDGELNQQSGTNDGFFLFVNALPVFQHQAGTQHQIEGHSRIAHEHIGAGGVIANGGLGVLHGQQQTAQNASHQKEPAGQIQPAGFSGLLSHKDGDILIEEENHQHHTADKQTVHDAVKQSGHGVQMVDGIDRDAIQNQMNQHCHQQGGKGFVQQTVLFLCGKVKIGDKGHHQKKSNFSPKHIGHLLKFIILVCPLGG